MIIHKQIFLFFVSLLFFYNKILAQTAIAIGEHGGEEAVEVFVFQDELTLGGIYQQQLGATISKGGTDVFLQQYDLLGQLIWQYSFGGVNNDILRGLSCSPNGSIYSAGTFSDSLFFGNGDTSIYSLQQAIFISKQNQQGQLQWAKSLGGQSLVIVEAIASDAQDNIYITGSFQNTFVVDSAHQLSGTATRDVFLIKLDANGKVLWAQQANYAQKAEGIALTLDDSGNIYLTGRFKGFLSLVQDTIQAHSVYTDIFLSRVDSNGNWIWQRHFGGSYDNNCKALQWHNGDLYLAGSFMGFLEIDTIRLVTAIRRLDGFIAKLNTDGTVQWASQSQTKADCEVEDFSIYNNQLIACGTYEDSLFWGSDLRQGMDKAEAFQLALNTDGQQPQLKVWNGNGFDLAKANAIHSSGQIITVGGFQQDLHTDSTTLTAQGFSDAFLSIQPPIELPNLVLQPISEWIKIEVFPNPSSDKISIQFKHGTIEKWCLFSINGQAVQQGTERSISLKNLARGAYILHLYTDKGLAVKKIVKHK